MPDFTEYTKFAVFQDSYSTVPRDFAVVREWFVRWNGNDPVLSRDFERAQLMSMRDATNVYRKIDGLGKKIGIVPVE